jgi:SNF2 family DNA or RNA helicase
MRVEADLHATRPDRIALVSPYTAKDMVRKVPGARWSKDDGKWSVPLAWTSCLAMRDIFGDDLIVEDGLSKWAWALKRDVIDPALAVRESLGAGIPGDDRLYDFQRAGVEFMRIVKRALLCDEMGTGKTVQTILALKALRADEAYEGPILVICPNTMKHTWKRELATWWPEVEAQVIQGTAIQRRKQIAAGADVLIINWEAVRTHSRLKMFGSTALKRCVECGGSGTVKQTQCEVHEREFNTIDFGAVVADEAHRMKDPHSAQTRAVMAASGDARVRFGLTGTPIANDPTELWSLLHWMDEQEWPTKSAWTERLIDFTYSIWGGSIVNGVKPTHLDEFRATVDPRMRRMPKSVVLPFLPPIVTQRRDVEMTPKQRKAYEDMRELMIARLDAGVLLAANPMVQVGRLMQLASSYGDMIVDPTSGEEHLRLAEPSSKLDAFMGDVGMGDYEGQSTIVFAESRQLIELLSERMHKNPASRGGPIRHGLITGAIAEDARDRTIVDFQKGDFQFVLCTIKAGGVGITLTQASAEAFLQRNWSTIDMDQAIARAHRIGSEIHESITVVDYVTPGTVEEAQIVALARKHGMLEEIVRDAEMMRKFLEGDLF